MPGNLDVPSASSESSFGPGLSFRTPEQAVPPKIPTDRNVAQEAYSEWNILSIIALAVSTLAVVLILGASSFEGVGYLLLLGFVLGLVGLVQASKRHQQGKGFAIAAMAIPVALLALVIAALSAWSGQV